MEQVAQRLEEAAAATCGGGGGAGTDDGGKSENMLLRYAERIRWLPTWYHAKLAAEPEPGVAPVQYADDADAGADTVRLGDAFFGTDGFSFLDDELWQGFVNDWDPSRSS